MRRIFTIAAVGLIAFLTIASLTHPTARAEGDEKLTPVQVKVEDVDVDDRVLIEIRFGRTFDGTVLFKGEKLIRVQCEVSMGVFNKEIQLHEIVKIHKYVNARDVFETRLADLDPGNIAEIEELFDLCVENEYYRRALKVAEIGYELKAKWLDGSSISDLCDIGKWAAAHLLFEKARAHYIAALEKSEGDAVAIAGLEDAIEKEIDYKSKLLVLDAPERITGPIEKYIRGDSVARMKFRDACRAVERFLNMSGTTLTAFEGYAFRPYRDYCVLDVGIEEKEWRDAVREKKEKIILAYALRYAALPLKERGEISREILQYESACREDVVDVRCPFNCDHGYMVSKEICGTCEGRPPQRVPCHTCGGRGEWNETCRDCGGTGARICTTCRGRRVRACTFCGGLGEYTCIACNGWGRSRCNLCNGTGQRDGQQCLSCNGRGEIICLYCYGRGRARCSRCRGSGEIDCSTCNGTGRLRCRGCNGHGAVHWDCKTCKKSGYVMEPPCRRCRGKGYVIDRRRCYHDGVKIGRRHKNPSFHY